MRSILGVDVGGTFTDVSLCPGRIGERDEARVGEREVWFEGATRAAVYDRSRPS